MRPELRHGAFVVGLHEPAESRDIRHENRCQPPLDVLGRHHRTLPDRPGVYAIFQNGAKIIRAKVEVLSIDWRHAGCCSLLLRGAAATFTGTRREADHKVGSKAETTQQCLTACDLPRGGFANACLLLRLSRP
jgi:hypothetical protein